MTGDVTRFNLANQSYDASILPDTISPQTWGLNITLIQMKKVT